MQFRLAHAAAITLSLAFAALPAAAQSGVATVQLSVVVLPRANAEQVGAPVLRSVSDGMAEYSVTLVVDANTAYRITARRAGSAAGATLVRTADGRQTELPSHADVVVANGDLGRSTLALSYWVPAGESAASAQPQYTVMLQTTRVAP